MITFSYYPKNGPFFIEQVDNGNYNILIRDSNGPMLVDTMKIQAGANIFVDELNEAVRKWAISKIQEEAG